MKISVLPINLQFGGNELTIPLPGKVRHVAFARSQKLVVSAPGDAGFEEVPCMFVEVGENAPVRRRHFVCIRPGQAVDGERCDWVGTGISGSGQVVHVFELEIKDAAS